MPRCASSGSQAGSRKRSGLRSWKPPTRRGRPQISRTTSSAIAHIRDASAFRRSAEKRIDDLEAELDAVRASAVRDIHSAEDRAEQAESRLAVEIERATSAERRLKLAEDRLEQVMAVIETELNPRAKRD